MSAPIVSLRDAAFGYAEGGAVVRGVTLDLFEGDVVALIGPNGSGKSTLVRGLLGLTELLGGTLELFGTPRERFTEHTRLGYVPQRHSLSASVRATTREVVQVGRIPHRRWWQTPGRADRDLVEESLGLVGLADRAEAEVSTLSGGQQRRVLIARALAGQPDVLLMDEPTAGVDSANQTVLAHVLDKLAHRGTTMVIVTHELDAIELILNRIICMRDGQVDFDGSPQEYAAHEAAHSVDSGHHHHDDPAATPARALVIGTEAGPLDSTVRAHRHD